MRRAALVALLTLGIAGAVVPAVAFAQGSETGAQTVDVIYLKNGTQVRGQVTELIPEDHVTIVTATETKRFKWSEIDRVVSVDAPQGKPTAPAKTAPTPPEPSSSATTPSKLDQPPGEPPPPQKPTSHANSTLLTAGAIMFGVGYGGPAIAALPNTVGLLGRIVILVLTLGLPCWFGNSGDYLCSADHGSIQLMIPFVGPILFAENHPHDTLINEDGRGFDGEVKAVLYASSILQIAGLGTIFAGLAMRTTSVPEPQKKSSTKPSFFVVPLDVPYSAGVSVGVHRW